MRPITILFQNPVRERRTYSKSSKREKDVLKIQQEREGRIQNPARESDEWIERRRSARSREREREGEEEMALRMKTGAAATSSSMSRKKVVVMRGGKRVGQGVGVRAVKREAGKLMVEEVEQKHGEKKTGVVFVDRIVRYVTE